MTRSPVDLIQKIRASDYCSCTGGGKARTPREEIRNISKTSILLLISVLLISGCAHYPVNAPLPAVDNRAGYRFQNVAPQTNSDDLALMLAFSGGGTRAAALSYSVLEELKKTPSGLSRQPASAPGRCRSHLLGVWGKLHRCLLRALGRPHLLGFRTTIPQKACSNRPPPSDSGALEPGPVGFTQV